MLRAVVIALVLANAAFFAWTQGWLDNVVGVRAIGDREPERLLRQVRPETIRILPPTATGVTAAPACLEAGPFAATEIAAAEGALRSALPNVAAGTWSSVKTDQPGAWIVYMGKFPALDLLNKKREELVRRNVAFEEVHSPAALDPGLSLGRFEERPSADKALEQFTQQGIRSARVVEITAPTSTFRLRVEQADAALASQLGGVKADALLGKGFAACANAPS
jgi:hypothetical protein